MSLATLSIAFSVLTLVLVAVLVCYLRRRAGEPRRTARQMPPPVLKKEE